MARLPQVGGDDGNWGSVLNEFLSESLNIDGSLKPIPQSTIQNLDTTLDTYAPLAGADFTGTVNLADGSPAVSEDTFNTQGPSGRELAYAESSVVQTGITTITDVTNLTVNFTVGSRPAIVEVILPFVYGSATPATATLTIADGANATRSAGSVGVVLANSGFQLSVKERISTPGSYTRKARIQRFAGAGTINLNFDSTTIASISVIER